MDDASCHNPAAESDGPQLAADPSVHQHKNNVVFHQFSNVKDRVKHAGTGRYENNVVFHQFSKDIPSEELLHVIPIISPDEHHEIPRLPSKIDGTLVSLPRGSYRRASDKLVVLGRPPSRDNPVEDAPGTQVVGIPSRFWIVKRPTPTSRVEDICTECSFTQFALMLKAGLLFKDIAGFYAWEHEALDRAQTLVHALHTPRAKIRRLVRRIFSSSVEIVGMPPHFWLVTKPTPTSQVEDVCTKCSFKRLAHMLKNGLLLEDIVGFYARKGAAIKRAQALVDALPPPDPPKPRPTPRPTLLSGSRNSINASKPTVLPASGPENRSKPAAPPHSLNPATPVAAVSAYSVPRTEQASFSPSTANFANTPTAIPPATPPQLYRYVANAQAPSPAPAASLDDRVQELTTPVALRRRILASTGPSTTLATAERPVAHPALRPTTPGLSGSRTTRKFLPQSSLPRTDLPPPPSSNPAEGPSPSRVRRQTTRAAPQLHQDLSEAQPSPASSSPAASLDDLVREQTAERLRQERNAERREE